MHTQLSMSIPTHLVQCLGTSVLHDHQTKCHRYQALGYQMRELSAPDNRQLHGRLTAMEAYDSRCSLAAPAMIAPLSIDLLLAAAYMLPLQQHLHHSVCGCIRAVLLLTDAGETHKV